MSMQDDGTALLEESARKQGESDGDQDDGTSKSDGDPLLSSSADQVTSQLCNAHKCWTCKHARQGGYSGVCCVLQSLKKHHPTATLAYWQQASQQPNALLQTEAFFWMGSDTCAHLGSVIPPTPYLHAAKPMCTITPTATQRID